MSVSKPKVPKGIHNIDWRRRAPWLISYFALKKQGSTPKATPALIRRYGESNFSVKKGELYIFDRRVVINPKEKQSILEELEEGVGGTQAAYSRVQRNHIGITLSSIRDFFRKSERRQVKRPKGSVNRQKTFIAESRPGAQLQCDNMFFPGSGTKLITVFGFVDVFSRYVWYTIIPNKTPWSTGAALKVGIEAFEKMIPGRVTEIRVDGGTEFFNDPRNDQLPIKDQKVDFKGYCKKRRIHLIAKKQPARNIESSNLRLRRYIERVQYGTRAELAKYIKRFCEEKNTTKHTITGMAPLDAIALDVKKTKELAKKQLAKGRKRTAASQKTGVAQRKLRVGDLVRMQLSSEKTKLGHAGVKGTWSKTIYKIKKIVGSTRGANRYKLEVDSGNPKEKNKPVAGLFFGWRLQYIVQPTHNINTKIKYDPGRAEKGDIAREEAARRPDILKEEWMKKPNYADAQDPLESDGEDYQPSAEEEDTDSDAERMDEKHAEPPKKAKAKPKVSKKPAKAKAVVDLTTPPGSPVKKAKQAPPKKQAPKKAPPKKQVAPKKAPPKKQAPKKAPPKKQVKKPAPKKHKDDGLPPEVKGISAEALKKTGLKWKAKPKPKKKSMVGQRIFVYWDDVESKSAVVVLEVYRKFYIVRWYGGDTSGVDARPGGEVARTTGEYMSPKTIEKYINENTQQMANIRKEIDDDLAAEAKTIGDKKHKKADTIDLT